MEKHIGMGIKGKVTEGDSKSPFSGQVKVRGRTFTGTVISAKMQRTATVEWTRRVKIPKYERYAKKRSRVKAHNPDSINAKEGDVVKIMECRPLSKTKHFVIVQNFGHEKGFAQRMEALEESKKSEEPKAENKDASSQSQDT